MFRVTCTVGTRPSQTFAITHSQHDAERLKKTAEEGGYAHVNIEEVSISELSPTDRSRANKL